MFESSETTSTSIFANLSKDTGLFLLFNLMILSILISSIFNTHKDHQNHHNQQDKLSQNLHQSPSILQKLISLNLYNTFKAHEEQPHNPYPQSHYYYNDLHEPQDKTHLPNSKTNQPNNNYGNFEQNYYNFDQAQELGHSSIMEDEHEEEVGDELTLDETFSRISNQNNNHFHTTNHNNLKPRERLSFNNEVPVKRLRKTASMKIPCSSSHYEDRVSIENRRPATMREARRSMAISEADEEVDERATDFINRFKQQLRLQRIESLKKYKDVFPRGSGL